MDLYEEKENVISSDEYSEDDDDDDALMNDAIKAQSSIKFRTGFSESPVHSKPKWRIEQKNMQLSSLIRSNKIFIIYKNKAIKWLNNKKQRERYKGHIYKKSQYFTTKSSSAMENNPTEVKQKVDKALYAVNCANKVEILNDENLNGMDDIAENFGISEHNDGVTNAKECGETVENSKRNQQLKVNSERKQKNEFAEKRDRSCSPIETEELNHNEKRFKFDTPQFYKKINEMFPKFDEIAKNHIEFITNGTLTATEEKMKSIFNEIQTLNDIIRTKEMEWNRLIHLKMIKEEIYTRLSRKRHALHLKETIIGTRNQSVLSELKELELYLSEKNHTAIPCNSSHSSIQQIIENRANMKTEDLQRESHNTSRLHSLLVSRNMLPSIDLSDNICSNGDIGPKCKSFSLNSSLESNKLFGNRTLLKRGRQGEFKDVKSIIDDFRQSNPDNLPRDMKTNQQLQYMQFSKDRKPDFSPRQNSTEEITITPSTSGKKMALCQELVYNNSMNRNYNVNLDDSNSLVNSKRDFEVSSPKGVQYPFCQECKIHESRFVCAGCGNQWYCSKVCQISAWDKHSEICTD